MNSKLTLLIALLAFATIATTAPVCSDIDEPAGRVGKTWKGDAPAREASKMIKDALQSNPLFSMHHRHIQYRYQNDINAQQSERENPIFRDPRKIVPLLVDCPTGVGQLIHYQSRVKLHM
ncbi:hypothetical protein B0H13DRAFT_2271550 [Mycena leptocephala]|nr:hypothetical protein B0H13DRAFT_2271550 [Mycena leptocephala]